MKNKSLNIYLDFGVYFLIFIYLTISLQDMKATFLVYVLRGTMTSKVKYSMLILLIKFAWYSLQFKSQIIYKPQSKYDL